MTDVSPGTATAPALFEPPAAVRVRGTLAVIAGAGESARVYERFGRRIAVDGYVVGVFETADATDAAGWLAAQETSPRVLVGSDAGAAAVLTLLAERSPVDGAIVAGTPVGDRAAAVEERSACPVHLGVLEGADARTARTAEVSLPEAAFLEGAKVPVLAVHGGADPVAPFDDAAAYLEHLPQIEVIETVGGLHDALNDTSHRSVAARVILWLEALRGGGPQTRVWGASA